MADNFAHGDPASGTGYSGTAPGSHLLVLTVPTSSTEQIQGFTAIWMARTQWAPMPPTTCGWHEVLHNQHAQCISYHFPNFMDGGKYL